MAETNNLGAIGDTLTMKLPKAPNALYAAFAILSLGTAVGASVVPEYSLDDGATWLTPLSVTPLGGGAAVTAIAAVGGFYAVVPGCTHVRLRLNALTSGGGIQCRINEVDY